MLLKYEMEAGPDPDFEKHWIRKSSLCQQSVIFTGRLNQDILIKMIQKKEAYMNELFIINNTHLENRQG